MNTLRRFLRRSFKNTNKARQLRLRRRLGYVMFLDRELEPSLDLVHLYAKYGAFWYNCIASEKPLWWVSKVKED